MLPALLVAVRWVNLVSANMVYLSPGIAQDGPHEVQSSPNLPELPSHQDVSPLNAVFISNSEDVNSTLEDEVNMKPPNVDCIYIIDATKGDNGTIVSPGFPNMYPALLNCRWVITASPGKKILAAFSEFDITDSTNCTSDYIVVNSGKKSNRYCGQSVPDQIESEVEVLELEFHTNSGDSCRGFSMDYTVVTKEVTCGNSTSDIQFLFRSPNYPLPLVNSTLQCDLTVSHDCNKPICQLRLDLIDFRLGPPTSGDCEGDQFLVRANEPLPILCGNNSNQHLYVDVRGRKETNLNILSLPILPKPVGVKNESDNGRVIVEWLSEVDPDRAFSILVTQIPCSCGDSSLPDPPAPPGCLQYHKGVSGVISSFNFDGTVRNYEPCWNSTYDDCGERMHTGHLNNLDYAICIQSNQGYCGITYSQVHSHSFQLTELPNQNTPSPGNGETTCFDDYLFVPRGANLADVNSNYPVERYCGQVLGNLLPGPVMSFSKPFVLQMRTDSTEPYSGVALYNRGFQLHYTQIPCSVEVANVQAFY